VRGNAFFRDAVHLLRADLHLKGLAAVEHGGMQGLVKIRPSDGDVILEASRDGAPDVVDHAKGGVTVALRIGNDAHGKQIVDLREADFPGARSCGAPNTILLPEIRARRECWLRRAWSGWWPGLPREISCGWGPCR